MYVEKPELGTGAVAYFDGVKSSPADIEEKVLYDAIVNGKELVVKPEHAMVVTQILEAIYESAKQNKTIYFD